MAQTLLSLLLVSSTLALRPLAAAAPLDPTWIEGMYDDADLDDVAALIGLLSSVFDAPGELILAPAPRLEALTSARVDAGVGGGRIALQGRAPPLG